MSEMLSQMERMIVDNKKKEILGKTAKARKDGTYSISNAMAEELGMGKNENRISTLRSQIGMLFDAWFKSEAIQRKIEILAIDEFVANVNSLKIKEVT